jgi:octaprenyl-diphosphate synthase
VSALAEHAHAPITPRTLADVQAMAAPEMRRVDQLIRARLGSDVVLINQVAEHIVGAGASGSGRCA